MSIVVESVRYIHSEGDVAVTVKLAQGKSNESAVFVVRIKFFEEQGIGVGEIDDETLEALAEESGIHSAFKRGLHILQYTSLSKKALEYRLLEKGVSKYDAERAVERLEFLRYLNERKSAMRAAQIASRKGWGYARIMREIRAKGFDDAACRQVEMCLEHVSFERHAAELLQKRFGGVPEDEKERQRAYRFLLNYGYSHAQIKRAFAALADDDIESLGRENIFRALSFD